jgi:MFS transporter, DHA2 family, multidrug resistance protein
MTADRADEAPVTLRTWIAVAGSLLGAFMAVLDIMIANASMPYIEGGIGTGASTGPGSRPLI